jgi:NMD protein affecting ribosome stability and mRNA decay
VTTSKGLIRSKSRRGVRSDKSPPVAGKTRPVAEGTMCERCGAAFARKTWRRGRRVTHAGVSRATWTVCPACQQASRGEYFGRVRIRGAYAAAHEEELRRRIQNVVERACFTQPERRLVGVARDGNVLEVLTTSQKLAHRIASELKKAFGGRARYEWSDDGSLFAVWERS